MTDLASTFARAPRLRLVKLDAVQETLTAQFNPPDLTLGLKAVWNKQIIPGGSRTQKQFSHTDDLTLNLDLFFRVTDPSDTAMAEEEAYIRTQRANDYKGYGEVQHILEKDSTDRFTIADRVKAESFLFSCLVPRGTNSIVTNSPPTVLVIWPNFLSFEANIESVSFKYTSFNSKGAPTRFMASVAFEEYGEVRYTSADARNYGFQRTRGGVF